MKTDLSREKSLLFLLTSTARKMKITNGTRQEFLSVLNSLTVVSNEDKWILSALDREEKISLSVPKSDFIFYAVKSSDRYPQNPAVVNQNSAQKVLIKLLKRFELTINGKRKIKKENEISIFYPHLIFTTLMISLEMRLVILASIILVASITYISRRLFRSRFRSFVIMLATCIPGIFYFCNFLNKQNYLNTTIIIVITFLLNDLRIRLLDSSLNYRKLNPPIIFIQILATITLVAVNAVRFTFPFIVLSISSILISLLPNSINNVKIRNSIFALGLIGTLLAASFWLVNSPSKILLIPIGIYCSIYLLITGSNRNPGRILIGVLCLSL